MRFPQAYAFQNALPAALPITGSAVTVVGASLDSGLCSLVAAAVVTGTITEDTMTLTGKWQVLVPINGTATWVDVVEPNNPANVAFATGTGSEVTFAKVFSAPLAVSAGNRSARFVVTNGVASGSGGTADTVTIGYDYRAPVSAYGT